MVFFRLATPNGEEEHSTTQSSSQTAVVERLCGEAALRSGISRGYDTAMTRDKALKLLKGGPEGVKEWNQWRIDNFGTEIPSLKGADLKYAHLEGADLRGAHLEGAKLGYAHLEGADFRDEAHLEKAELNNAHLEKAKLGFAHLEGAHLWHANLEGADLPGAHLEGANLRLANFSNVLVAVVTYDRRTTKFRGIRVDTCHRNPLFKRDAQDQDYIETRTAKICDDKYLLEGRIEELKDEVDSERPGTHDNPSWQWWKKRCALWKLTYAEPVKLWPSRIWTVVWGRFDYGRDWIPVVYVAIAIAIVFGLIYSFWPGMLEYNNPKMEQSLLTPFYYSIVTYMTLGSGDMKPITHMGQILVIIEGVFGFVTLGLLISILANRVARRS